MAGILRIGRAAVLGVVLTAAVSHVAAQVNILSDVINFRQSGSQDKLTTHHGRLDGKALLSWGQYGIGATNTSTSYADGIALYGRSAPTPGYGIGGQFIAGYKALEAYGTMPGSGSRYGGYFVADNGSYNYAVYATTYGDRYTSNSWAGWFDGDVRVTQLLNPSDARLKTDITDYAGGLNDVMQLRPKSYRYRLDDYPDLSLPEGTRVGLIAQEVEEVMPRLVTDAVMPQTVPDSAHTRSVRSDDTEPQTMKHLNTLELVPVLVSAIQEQQALLDRQEERIRQLEALVRN